MKNNTIKILAIFISSFCFSQQDVVGTGGDAKSLSGSFSYSVGQILVSQMGSDQNTWSSDVITLNHGVQQYFIPSCEKNSTIKILASPNPSKGLVNINFENWDDVELSLSVYDVLGKLILSNRLNQKTTQLNLAGLSSGMYIISIQNICGGASSFKLILNTN